MIEVIEILKRNSNIKNLLDEFKKNFEETYYELNDEQKNNMLFYADTIFRKWLFSPLIDGTYLTPNFIVNNIAQQRIKGSYCVIPYISIKFDLKGKLKFKTKFIYHSNDRSPVVEDLEKILSIADPTIIARDENLFVIDNGEKLVDKLSIRSDYYIEYLIELAIRLKLLEVMKSIGCKCYKRSEKYDDFKEFTYKEKLKLIIDKSIEISSEKISEIIEINKKDSVLEFLDNGITEENYFENMKSSLKIATDFVNNISEYAESEEEIINIAVAKSMLGDKIGYWLVKREAGLYLDINLTCIFGYYLGITNPVYEESFLPSLFMELINYSDDPVEKTTYIFSMELAHDLTSFGEEILKEYKEKLNDNNFKFLIPSNIKKCICEYIQQNEIILKDIKKEDESFIKKIIGSTKSNLKSKYK